MQRKHKAAFSAQRPAEKHKNTEIKQEITVNIIEIGCGTPWKSQSLFAMINSTAYYHDFGIFTYTTPEGLVKSFFTATELESNPGQPSARKHNFYSCGFFLGFQFPFSPNLAIRRTEEFELPIHMNICKIILQWTGVLSRVDSNDTSSDPEQDQALV